MFIFLTLLFLLAQIQIQNAEMKTPKQTVSDNHLPHLPLPIFGIFWQQRFHRGWFCTEYTGDRNMKKKNLLRITSIKIKKNRSVESVFFCHHNNFQEDEFIEEKYGPKGSRWLFHPYFILFQSISSYFFFLLQIFEEVFFCISSWNVVLQAVLPWGGLLPCSEASGI